MKSIFLTLFLTFLAVSITSASPQKYAVLVATTKSWVFYRHQASVLKAYETLIANGFQKKNIITLVYDDIANDPKNPEPGVVRSNPLGPDLYSKAKIDYRGNAVNATTFLAVLTGNSKQVDGPVIKSGPKDTIFIYISGLGSYGTLTFPSGPGISASTFMHTLKQIKEFDKARKILVNLDVSFAASIAQNAPRGEKIFINAATHYTELPYAAYCDRSERICYSTLFGAAWTYRSDRLRQLKYGRRESLYDFFNWIRTITVYTNVNIFGELEMGREKVRGFLDYKLEKKPQTANIVADLGESAFDEVSDKLEENPDDEALNRQYDALYETYGEGINEEKEFEEWQRTGANNQFNVMHELEILPSFMVGVEDAEKKYNNIPGGHWVEDYYVLSKAALLKSRNEIKETMKNILKKLGLDFDSLAEPTGELSDEVAENYEKSIAALNENCFDLNENTHVLLYLSKLAKINQMKVPLEKQIHAMQSVCSHSHRQMRSVH